MMMLTKEIKKRLPPLYGTEKIPAEDKEVIVKFFNPCGAATWYAVEGSPEGDDFIFFGYVNLGMGPSCSELGYFGLNELMSVRVPPFGLKIERDRHFSKGQKLGQFME